MNRYSLRERTFPITTNRALIFGILGRLIGEEPQGLYLSAETVLLLSEIARLQELSKQIKFAPELMLKWQNRLGIHASRPKKKRKGK
jgi:hypothetical protein